MICLRIGILVGVFAFAHGAWGLTEYHRAMPKKLNSYLSEGAFIGGVAGRGFSLRNVSRQFGAKSKIERVVVDLGDEKGRSLLSPAPYFHVEVDPRNSRVVIDLSQVQGSRLSEENLKKVFSGSPYVSLMDIGYDPEDRATHLTLKMKRPLMVEIFSPEGKNEPGRIIMDFVPEKLGKILSKQKARVRAAADETTSK